MNANPNVCDSTGKSMMHLLAGSDDNDGNLVNWALNLDRAKLVEDINVDVFTNSGVTPLMLACKIGSIGAVTRLL